MIREPRRSDGEPHDRLTALALHMLGPLEVEPDVKAIVLLDSDVERAGGAVFHGYAPHEEAEAIVRLLSHTAAMLASHGKTLRQAIDLFEGS